MASNATSTSPTEKAYFFSTNPGSFAFPGTLIAASQQMLVDQPDPVTVDPSNGSAIVQFGYSVEGNPSTVNLSPNESFTCTVYDNATFVASGTGYAGGMTNNNVSNAAATCQMDFPASAISNPEIAGSAQFAAPSNTIDTNHFYTIILSH